MLALLSISLALVPLVLGLDPQARTSKGEVVGRVLMSRDGREYSAFTGVPFAKPPLGVRRFMAPEPADEWSGVLNATMPSPRCFQANIFGSGFDGQEDCLYLDIYVPQVKTKKPLPVIFSIYGGAFLIGSTNGAEASKFFMDEDIVLVETNYRLGTLGFLSFEDETMPGNMGLKDQALALEWVRREISSFGGDPNLVTVIGESAGGVSSHLICSAPRTTGLIKGCISQSGVGWAGWALQPPGAARSKAFILAEAVGCTDNLLQCLQSKPVVEVANYKILPQSLSALPAGPVLEPASAPGALITQWPTGSKDFPWITGVVHDEGIVFTAEYELHMVSQEEIDEYIENFDKTISEELNLQNRTDVLKKIKERFFIEDVEPLIAIRNLYTELAFVYPALEGLSYHTGPKYFYHFNYGSGPINNNTYNVTGVPHGAEMRFFFDLGSRKFSQPLTTPEDVKLSKLLVKMWADFATNQAPSDPSFWSKFYDEKYLYIGNSEIALKTCTRCDDILNFWKNLL